MHDRRVLGWGWAAGSPVHVSACHWIKVAAVVGGSMCQKEVVVVLELYSSCEGAECVGSTGMYSSRQWVALEQILVLAVTGSEGLGRLAVMVAIVLVEAVSFFFDLSLGIFDHTTSTCVRARVRPRAGKTWGAPDTIAPPF